MSRSKYLFKKSFKPP